MATQISSVIGASLDGSQSNATALFALGSVANGTGGSRWEYVQATSTFITGELVLVNPYGTAKTLTLGLWTANADGYDIGFVQGLLNQGEHAWIAKQGRGLYVLCTGTITAGNNTGVGLASGQSGRLGTEPAAAVGGTMFGCFITSSTPTDSGTVVTQATITWPRLAQKQ